MHTVKRERGGGDGGGVNWRQRYTETAVVAYNGSGGIQKVGQWHAGKEVAIAVA